MAIDTLSDIDLVLRFESLGDSCEFGLLQRRVGAEPLGLFRFAGAPLRHLIRAMDAGFVGMADAEHVRVQPEGDEYMIKLTKYDFIYHTHVKIGAADPEVLHRQQVRTVRFLLDKLIADLAEAAKIMVFRQNEELSANDLLDFRTALSSFGNPTLLWVQAARPGFPAGQVVVVDDTLMIGYVTRLARRDNAPNFDQRSWLAMLRRAYAAWPARTAGRTDAVFGREGNTAELVRDGWSAPENGFTWSIEDRSALVLANPGPAGTVTIEMDVVPFIALPALPAQTLRVSVNGGVVHSFDPLPRGIVACDIPGHLLEGREMVDITLDHPNAAAPADVAGQDDRRRLAVAFRRLSLICR